MNEIYPMPWNRVWKKIYQDKCLRIRVAINLINEIESILPPNDSFEFKFKIMVMLFGSVKGWGKVLLRFRSQAFHN